MKIKKLETLTFPIAGKKEEDIEKKLLKKRGGRLNPLSPREKAEVKKGYLPLAKYKATRREKARKGFETRENYFYVDLNKADIYHIRKDRIDRYDLPKKLLDLTPAAITEFGNLLRNGSRYREELDQDVVLELTDMGLVHIYKLTGKQLAALLIDELSADPKGRVTQTKEHIKAAYPLPRFTDNGYDLTTYLEIDDCIVESYQKNPIKYSTDRIGKILRYLFNAKINIEGMAYIPYMQGEYRKNGEYKTRNSDIHYPVCLKKDKKARKKEGVKLKPIALSTDIGTKDTVPMETSTIDFTDIVGLDEVKKEIEDAIIRPIKEPEMARKFGKKGGGAILLYGPPGCGKTHIAKAAVGECGVPFFNVNISDIVGMGAEEGARSLHNIFDEANRNSPSIIFLDEIDAIGGKRDSGQKHTEKMGVTQLLMEMDGAQGLMENVLIIAATNAPWAIDPALRRAGRFTKQIYIPPPDLKAREGIFRIHTKEKPVSEDIDYGKLAEQTEGYSSSDIKAICDRVAQILWDDASKKGIDREIRIEDFIKTINEHETSLTPWFRLAQKEMRKSGEEDLYREFTEHILKNAGGVEQVQKPDMKFTEVAGMEKVKEEIRKAIIYPIEKPELAEKFGKDPGGAMLLYGPPGCGKTYIAKATAGECNASFYNINITDILSQDPGESERNIREIFQRAKKNTPAVIFFDEFDAIGGRRDHITGETEKRIVNQFLTEMDGFMERKDIMIIAATNAPWNIDPALRRSGRFTKQIHVPPPDLEAREQIFRIHTKEKPVSENIDYEKLAEQTEGYSSSDIKAICDLAAEIPWGEALKGREERDITAEDFLNAIEEQPSSLKAWFAMAEKQIRESGEKDIYEELSKLIEDYGRKKQDWEKFKEAEVEIIPPQEEENEKVGKLMKEKRRLEEMIELARIRYNEGVINREDFELIVMHYQMEIIGIEVKIKELNNPTIGSNAYKEAETVFNGNMEKNLKKPYRNLTAGRGGGDGLMWMKDIEWSVAQHPGGRVHYRIRSMRGDVYKSLN